MFIIYCITNHKLGFRYWSYNLISQLELYYNQCCTLGVTNMFCLRRVGVGSRNPLWDGWPHIIFPTFHHCDQDFFLIVIMAIVWTFQSTHCHQHLQGNCQKLSEITILSCKKTVWKHIFQLIWMLTLFVHIYKWEIDVSCSCCESFKCRQD